MSIKAMSRVWDESPSKENKLLTLLAIADNANDDGWAFPSQQTLANRVKVEKRSLQRILDELESEGEVIIYNRTNPDNPERHLSNVYHLAKYGVANSKHPDDWKGNVKPRVLKGSDASVARVVTPESLGSDASVARVVTPGTPDPLLNHLGTTTIKKAARKSKLKTVVAEVPEPEDTATTSIGKPPTRLYLQMPVKGGMDKWDGHFVAPHQHAEYGAKCNDLFYAWLETLDKVGRKPMNEVSKLWLDSRNDIKQMIADGVTEEEISSLVEYLYDPKNNTPRTQPEWWQKNMTPISINSMAKMIGVWRSTRQELAKNLNGHRPQIELLKFIVADKSIYGDWDGEE